MPRERCYRQLVARQSRPRQGNSWRFRVDLAMSVSGGSVGWTKGALVMHGAFCDQPWPGNDAGDDSGLSRTVGSGDTRRTRLIPCACPMFCFVGLLSAIRELIFRYFAEEENIQQNAKQNAEIRDFSVKTREKNVVNDDPKRPGSETAPERLFVHMISYGRRPKLSFCRLRSRDLSFWVIYQLYIYLVSLTCYC